MSEVVNNNNAQAQNDGAVNAQATQQQETPQVVVACCTTTTEKKPNWFKTNWKKVLAGAGAVLAVVGSGAAAYAKGKKAGVNMAYAQQPDQEDYSLDPNV